MTIVTPPGPVRTASFILIVGLAATGCGASPGRESAVPEVDDASAQSVDSEALEHLLARATEEQSSAIAISHRGQTVAVWGEDEAMSAMSASKSVASLAVGFLVDDGLVTLDMPVSTWVSEWQDTRYEAITVRHLLNHTSGLDPTRADIGNGDIAAHATLASLLSEPGARFQYNNNAVDLLAVVVGRAAGRPMDAILEERLFEPLGIHEATWLKDAQDVPFAAGELTIRPTSLLRVGEMLATGGMWRGRQIVSAEWIALSTVQSQPHVPAYGLLWWREGEFRLAITPRILRQWRGSGAPADITGALQSLQDTQLDSYNDLTKILTERIGEEGLDRWLQWLRSHRELTWADQVQAGPVVGYSARGWLGQFLVVLPQHQIVAVRMRRPNERDFGGGAEQFAYPEFPADVVRLAGDDITAESVR